MGQAVRVKGLEGADRETSARRGMVTANVCALGSTHATAARSNACVPKQRAQRGLTEGQKRAQRGLKQRSRRGLKQRSRGRGLETGDFGKGISKKQRRKHHGRDDGSGRAGGRAARRGVAGRRGAFLWPLSLSRACSPSHLSPSWHGPLRGPRCARCVLGASSAPVASWAHRQRHRHRDISLDRLVGIDVAASASTSPSLEHVPSS